MKSESDRGWRWSPEVCGSHPAMAATLSARLAGAGFRRWPHAGGICSPRLAGLRFPCRVALASWPVLLLAWGHCICNLRHVKTVSHPANIRHFDTDWFGARYSGQWRRFTSKSFGDGSSRPYWIPCCSGVGPSFRQHCKLRLGNHPDWVQGRRRASHRLYAATETIWHCERRHKFSCSNRRPGSTSQRN